MKFADEVQSPFAHKVYYTQVLGVQGFCLGWAEHSMQEVGLTLGNAQYCVLVLQKSKLRRGITKHGSQVCVAPSSTALGARHLLSYWLIFCVRLQHDLTSPIHGILHHARDHLATCVSAVGALCRQVLPHFRCCLFF